MAPAARRKPHTRNEPHKQPSRPNSTKSDDRNEPWKDEGLPAQRPEAWVALSQSESAVELVKHARAIVQDAGGPMAVWRVCFYTLMAYEWTNFHLEASPMVVWKRAFAYTAAEWCADLAPTTLWGMRLYHSAGVTLALASNVSDWATAPFAVIYVHYLATAITNFTNHDYLFALISVVMAAHANSRTRAAKSEWLHALRGQIIVVYFYATVWKLHPDWLDGSIISGILLSFEQQGVSRGIPWAAIGRMWPGIFQVVALVGLSLDCMLYMVLSFSRPGSPLQFSCVIFHGFTALAMSQRIGYTFPAAMLLSSLLFQPMRMSASEADCDCDEPEEAEEPAAGRKASFWPAARGAALERRLGLTPHFVWLGTSLRTRKFTLPVLWVVVQWLLPLRMPFVSRGQFRHTAVGYRCSWTMMLHAKTSLMRSGAWLAELRPACGSSPFANPALAFDRFAQPNAFSYLPFIGVRGRSALEAFPAQLPGVANAVRLTLGTQCPNGNLSIRATYFSSANGGPFVRLMDPAVDVDAVYDARKHRPWWQALLEVPPAPELSMFFKEGSYASALPAHDAKQLALLGYEVLVDRAPCLRDDPIVLAGQKDGIELAVWHASTRTDLKVTAVGCLDAARANCKSFVLNRVDAGTLYLATKLPPTRLIAITVADIDVNGKCASAAEDIVVLTRSPMSAFSRYAGAPTTP